MYLTLPQCFLIASEKHPRPGKHSSESSHLSANLNYRQRVHLLGMSTTTMGGHFYELAFTPNVKALQQQHGSRRQYERMEQASIGETKLGSNESAFIAARDSFYMASVSETGWPYLQHRGGPKGFVKTLDPGTLGFADLRGNKQYISLGNFQHDDRVALFFMDYPNQTRLKLLGRVEVKEAGQKENASLLQSLRTAEPGAVPERAILIHVEGFDWNCPQHITPRYTANELEEALAPLHQKLAALEAENATLRANSSGKTVTTQ